MALSACIASAPLASAQGAEPPQLTAPLPGLSLDPSTVNEHALDLSLYFSYEPGLGADYWSVRLVQPAPTSPTDPVLFVNGTWLGVAAPDPSWAGTVVRQVEACAFYGSETSCAISNPFNVTVGQALPPGPTPGPAPASGSLRAAAEGEAWSFTLVVPPSDGSPSSLRWFLDGAQVGEGPSITLGGLSPGSHRMVATYMQAGVAQITYRDFQVAGPPPPGVPTALVAALAAGLGLAFVVIPSRSRNLLLVAIALSVHPRDRKDTMLDHFNRGALYQLIKENPGIHFSELRRRVGIAHGTAIWHLRALEAAEIVQATRVGAYTTYHATDRPLRMETYGLSPSDRLVLEIVRETPGIALRDLARRGQRSLGTTSRAVNRLVALGRVTTEVSRRRRLIYPRDDDLSGAVPSEDGGA